jgi:hypothetical protein
MSGINRPAKNLNRNPRQANQLLSQQNLPKAVITSVIFKSTIESQIEAIGTAF